MITRLLNVALNQFSNVSVSGTRSRRGAGAERDSEYDRAIGEIMRLLRRHCCYSWLLTGFRQWLYLHFNTAVGSNWSCSSEAVSHLNLNRDIVK